MATAEIFDDDGAQRQWWPSRSAPTPTAAPAVPSTPQPAPAPSPTPSVGTQTDAGWMYPWRSEPYQGQLGAGEIEQQKQEYAYRNANPGMKLPEDTAGLMRMIGESQSGGGRNYNLGGVPGFQFDDPYTKQLEDLVRQNMSQIQQPQSNPALEQLLQFLNKQFTDLSTSPGYSPEEMAIIRTQMQEPIERDRAANRDRVLQRTAARGMLPSSGLHEQDLQDFVDRPAMEARTAAGRDLAINAIGQRRQDLNQAMQFGKVAGIDIPGLQRGEDQGRRAEMLNLSSLLYDLPNRAMQSANSVINGTAGPEHLFNQSIQLQEQQRLQQQANADKWTAIGKLIAELY